MPPPVALLIFLALSTVLLVRDCRRRKTVSGWIWLPTLLLLILGSRPLSMWFQAVSSESAEGAWIDQAFYLCLLLACLWVASSRGVKWARLLRNHTAITVFYLYFLVSVMWSDDPAGAVKRWIKVFGLIFVIGVMYSEKDPLEAIRAVYFRCACVLIPVSVLFVRYYPGLGRSYGRAGDQMFTGITTQKNSLGEVVLVFSLMMIWDYLEVRDANSPQRGPRLFWDVAVLLSMGMWLIQMSDSKTALMCTLLGLALMMGKRRHTSTALKTGILLASLSMPFLLLFVQRFTSFLAPLVGALGRDLTFTGRSDVWGGVLSTDINPVFGAGFFSFWGTEGGERLREAMHTPGLHSAHNGYLDLYLDGGLVGVALLLCMLFGGRRLIRNSGSSLFERVKFALLIVAIIYNLSESTFARLTPMGFTVLLVLLRFSGKTVGARESRVESRPRNGREYLNADAVQVQAK